MVYAFFEPALICDKLFFLYSTTLNKYFFSPFLICLLFAMIHGIVVFFNENLPLVPYSFFFFVQFSNSFLLQINFPLL